MNRDEEKKHLETKFFESFRRSYPFIPEGKAIPRENPDFELKCKDGSIGIEICRLFKDSQSDSLSIQAQKNIQNKLIEIAEKEYAKNEAKKFRTIFGFPENSGIKPNNLNSIAKHICDVVKEMVQNRTPSKEQPIKMHKPELGRFGIPLELIQIYDHSEFFRTGWEVSNVYTTPTFNIERFKNELRKKEENFEHYKRFEKMWLLFIIDFWDSNLNQAMPEFNEISVTNSNYDKIIVYEYPFEKYVNIYRQQND